MDTHCCKCNEPWDASLEDLSYRERRLFRAGHGCPCCGFGKYCSSCGGTGAEWKYDKHGCADCKGFRSLIVPHVEVVGSNGILRVYEDGTCKVTCPTCGDAEPRCISCNGTGELVPDEKAGIRQELYFLLGDDVDGLASELELLDKL